MKKLLSALFVLALCASAASANIPDPPKCSVSPADDLTGVVLAPDSPNPIPSTVYTVTVRNNANDPIPNATVTVQFATGIRVCSTAQHTQTTNASGICQVTLKGGGCLRGVSEAVRFLANGFPIRTYVNAKSPDFDGSGPDGLVNLSDLVAYKAGNLCHDYNTNGFVGLEDLVIFASAYSPAHNCTLLP